MCQKNNLNYALQKVNLLLCNSDKHTSIFWMSIFEEKLFLIYFLQITDIFDIQSTFWHVTDSFRYSRFDNTWLGVVQHFRNSIDTQQCTLTFLTLNQLNQHFLEVFKFQSTFWHSTNIFDTEQIFSTLNQHLSL